MRPADLRPLDSPSGSSECGDRCDTDSSGRRRFRGLWFDDRWPRGAAQGTGAFVWLAFILFPAINAFAKHGTALRHWLTVAGAVAFVALYVALVLLWRARRADRALTVLFVLLVAVATALTLSNGNSWGFLFTYCAACAGLISRRFGFAGVIGCSVLAGTTAAIGGANGGQVIGWIASSAGIGMLILVMRDLRLRNEQLSAARAEMARMAVAQERERFARDLHDLLGHSLSVIALKAELAGRMLATGSVTARSRAAGSGALGSSAADTGAAGSGATDSDAADPEASILEHAATEIRELEQVARTALSEVREAVSGYHQPTLEGELAGARMALSAAGIEANVQQAHVPLDPAVEAVLAWAIREGATNVIRHSGARHCTLRITATLTDAGVEVIDDGVGDAARANGAATPNAQRADGSNDDQGRRASGAADDRRTIGLERSAVATPVGLGTATSGHGLAGLAERARLVNGTIEAGALAGGGYRLAVTVPVSHT